ncbi:MAG: hypothetical protein JSS27_00385 [Planctomycetes bacterium]|nr:hypothetical protein [Planctomycetota bacterium]
MDAVLEIIGWVFVCMLQAIAALHWPSDDPKVRRLQRWCLISLLAGIVAVGGSIALAYFSFGWPAVVLLISAIALFVIGGILGGDAERRCLSAWKQRKGAPPTSKS